MNWSKKWFVLHKREKSASHTDFLKRKSLAYCINDTDERFRVMFIGNKKCYDMDKAMFSPLVSLIIGKILLLVALEVILNFVASYLGVIGRSLFFVNLGAIITFLLMILPSATGRATIQWILKGRRRGTLPGDQHGFGCACWACF